jgi:hypothetical protein
MDNTRLSLILQTVTNLVVIAIVGAGFLTGKVTSEQALFPLLAISGIEYASRKSKSGGSPPAGPAALALLMATEVFSKMAA